MASFNVPVWRAARAANNNVTVTPCDFGEMRLLDVRIPWDPSSWTEDAERKDIFFELNDPAVRAFLQTQEEAIGASKSCMAKDGLLRCKINVKHVCLFDKDRCLVPPPERFAGWTCNVVVKLCGKWQTGSASGLNLQATDIQLLRPYRRECPF